MLHFTTLQIRIGFCRRYLFSFGAFFARRVNLLMGYFLAFRGGYIKYASCPGYHLSSRRNGLPHPPTFSPIPIDCIQPLCDA